MHLNAENWVNLWQTAIKTKVFNLIIVFTADIEIRQQPATLMFVNTWNQATIPSYQLILVFQLLQKWVFIRGENEDSVCIPSHLNWVNKMLFLAKDEHMIFKNSIKILGFVRIANIWQLLLSSTTKFGLLFERS